MRKHALALALCGFAVSSYLGCGGSSVSTTPPPPPPPPAQAQGLAYADPGGSAGWALVKDASSTSSRLVLNVVGPKGLLTRGVGFNIQAPQGVVFDTFTNGLPINDTGVYDLTSATANPGDPVALVGALKPGNVLTVGIYQKGQEKPSKDSGTALCQIALKLDPKAKLLAGQSLTLKVPKAKVIPDDLGTSSDSTYVMSQKYRMQEISLAVGALAAN
jgi:hypothetical protein